MILLQLERLAQSSYGEQPALLTWSMIRCVGDVHCARRKVKYAGAKQRDNM